MNHFDSGVTVLHQPVKVVEKERRRLARKVGVHTLPADQSGETTALHALVLKIDLTPARNKTTVRLGCLQSDNLLELLESKFDFLLLLVVDVLGRVDP